MKNKKTEKRVAESFRHAQPDVYRSVAEQCPTRERVARKSHVGLGWKLSTCTLALLLVVAIVFGGVAMWGGKGNDTVAVAASVTLDVNPSIDIQLSNAKGRDGSADYRVASIKGNNADGVGIIGSMDLKGVQLEVAVNALIGSMLRKGYIRADANSVLVSVDSDSQAVYDQIVSTVCNEITIKMRESQIDASVVSQWIKETDANETLAAQYRISVGKAQLINKILANKGEENYTAEQLSKLTINDLNIILSGLTVTDTTGEDITQSGSASTQSYGRERALEIAFGRVQSGLTEENVLGLKAKLDFDDGIMVWEVEFCYGTNEYEFEIGAISGEIISFECETAQYTPDTTQTAKTEEEIKTLAKTLAGVPADDTTVEVFSERCRFWGQNIVYSLWFSYNDTYFEYEIDVYGAVLYSFEQKFDTAADAYMDRSEIKDFLIEQGELSALTPVSGYRVTSAAQTDEQGNTIIVYTVTYSIGDITYTYTIDALNRKILSRDVSEKTAEQYPPFHDWFDDEWNDWKDDDWDWDYDDGYFGGHKQPSQSSGTLLTEDQIKTYLLNQLIGQFGNILLEETSDWEIELEEEFGGKVYEVEFQWNGLEFECDVDATTGMLIRGTWDYADGFEPSRPAWNHAR